METGIGARRGELIDGHHAPARRAHAAAQRSGMRASDSDV